MTQIPTALFSEHFNDAIARIREVTLPAEITCSEIPAPSQMAPFSFAVRAEVDAVHHGSVVSLDLARRSKTGGHQDHELADGKFVLLYDPAGQDQWDGCFRVVALASARVETEFALDPVGGSFAWSWIHEALDIAGVKAHEIGATVTRVHNQTYGTLASRGENVHLELRTSWTPSDDNIAGHFGAFLSIVSQAAGLPPA